MWEALVAQTSGNATCDHEADYGHSFRWMSYGADNKLRCSQTT